MPTYIASDQYGNMMKLYSKHPRKELMDYYGSKHADKIYRDIDGDIVHIGWIVCGHWYEVFKVSTL